MKRWGMVLMVLGVFAAFFGCSKQQNDPWSSFCMNQTSSVLSQAYHFSVYMEAEGRMTVQGYCFEGGTEYRAEQAMPLSEEEAEIIRNMALETAPTKKTSLKDRLVSDGTQQKVTLTHQNGEERVISLSDIDRQSLETLLRQALCSAVQTSKATP